MYDTATPSPSSNGVGKVETGPSEVPSDASPTDLITVYLIEDNRLVREGIVAVLQGFGGIEVIASEPVRNGTMTEEISPHVVLLDIGLEDGDSLDIARGIVKDFPDAGVIVMDLLPAAHDLVDYISAGVSGFMMKDAPLDEVERTIRAVAAGKDVLPEAMTATLFSTITEEAATHGGDKSLDSVRLTPREREVIELIAEGMSNKAIGRNLHISIHTVKSHLRNIMERLNLHSRLQLARYVDDVEQNETATG